jgi:hypothetical protein
MMGIYPPNSGDWKLTKGERDSLSKRGQPPMKIRNSQTINMELQDSALPNDFVGFAIPTFLDLSLEDDVSYDGCSYASASTDDLCYDDNTYSDYFWMN